MVFGPQCKSNAYLADARALSFVLYIKKILLKQTAKNADNEHRVLLPTQGLTITSSQTEGSS